MIKDIFVFKKNSWHLVLMNWTWGFGHSDFRNMCPYFWLSVFNVFLGWYTVLPIRQIGKLFVAIISSFQYKVEEYRQESERKDYEYREKLKEELAIVILDPTKLDNSVFERYYLSRYAPKGLKRSVNKSIYDAIRYNISYFEAFDKVIEYLDKKWDDAFEKQRRINELQEEEKSVDKGMIKVKTAKTIANITKYTKSITGYLMYGIGGLIGWFSFWIASKLYNLSSYIDWWFVFSVFTVVIGIVIFIGLVILLSKFIELLWCKYGKYCVPCEERRELIGNIFLSILATVPFIFFNMYPVIWDSSRNPKLGPITWLFVKLWSGIKSIWDLLMAMKQDNCPGIEWKD